MNPTKARQRLVSAVLSVTLSVGSGCVVTHPRSVDDLGEILESPRTILVLAPRVEVWVKNMSTEEFFRVDADGEEFAGELVQTTRTLLEGMGHGTLVEESVDPGPGSSGLPLDRLRAKLLDLAEQVISRDPEHVLRTIPEGLTAKGLIPPELLGQAELIVAVHARAKKETHREFWQRWRGNLGLNIVLLPLTLVWVFAPVALPASVYVTTNLVTLSPDRLFSYLIAVDAASGRIIYQNDFFSKWVPEDEDDYRRLVERLLEGFQRE